MNSTIELKPRQTTAVRDRLTELESANERLRELVQHCSVYATHATCGYQQMNAAQKTLFDDVIGASGLARSFLYASASRSAAAWRRCEFCDCSTNARERICCQAGRDADRNTWERPLSSRPGRRPG